MVLIENERIEDPLGCNSRTKAYPTARRGPSASCMVSDSYRTRQGGVGQITERLREVKFKSGGVVIGSHEILQLNDIFWKKHGAWVLITTSFDVGVEKVGKIHIFRFKRSSKLHHVLQE